MSQNSDSELCTESRLGQVHNVHTPMAQAACWAGRVMAHQVPCRRPLPTVSWPSSRSCRSSHRSCRRPCWPCRVLYLGLCRRVPASAAARRVAGLLGHVACTVGRIVTVPGHVAPPSWRAQAYVPAVCLLGLLCAYSACCVCSACCVPQYSLLYCDLILENG